MKMKITMRISSNNNKLEEPPDPRVEVAIVNPISRLNNPEGLVVAEILKVVVVRSNLMVTRVVTSCEGTWMVLLICGSSVPSMWKGLPRVNWCPRVLSETPFKATQTARPSTGEVVCQGMNMNSALIVGSTLREEEEIDSVIRSMTRKVMKTTMRTMTRIKRKASNKRMKRRIRTHNNSEDKAVAVAADII